MVIDLVTLNIVKRMICRLETEICGIIVEDTFNESKIGKNKAFLFAQVQGEKNSCQIPKYSDIIWHTHSFASKGYPSGEDIVQVLNGLAFSLVFTCWGIWKIENIGRRKLARDERRKLSENLYLSFLDKIYFETKKATKFALDVVSRILKEMNTYTEHIGIKTHFSLWNNKDYVI